MKFQSSGLIAVTILGSLLFGPERPRRVFAAEIVTLENVVDPGDNSRDEPYAKDFSLEKANVFLDSAALNWQKERQCFTCHTNLAHLYARPALNPAEIAPTEVRKFAEELISRRWEEKGPRWDAEVVAIAAALAFNDAALGKELHPLSRQALDRMWTVQREDGGFDWIKCGWPPMEIDDHYGATLAAIAVGVAPSDYASTPQAQQGMTQLRTYLQQNPGPTIHHRAMILWGDSYNQKLITSDENNQVVKTLFELQKADGGWGMASLGDWKRANGEAQDLESSDGYGTGFTIYILRRSGVPSSDPRIQRGIAWLKSHQRESGRWFTRSLFKDSRHYITHAGTAFSVMALQACEPDVQ